MSSLIIICLLSYRLENRLCYDGYFQTVLASHGKITYNKVSFYCFHAIIITYRLKCNKRKSNQFKNFRSKAVLLLWIFYVFSVLCLLCLCERLFICALWSLAGKGLTSWLLFVVSNCEFVTFPLGERSGSVVYCLTRDRRAAGSSLTGVTALCPWARTLILA